MQVESLSLKLTPSVGTQIVEAASSVADRPLPLHRTADAIASVERVAMVRWLLSVARLKW